MKKIVLACGAYDRTAALLDGRVRVEGADVTTLTLPVEEIFFRTARHAEFDVAEMSLSSYAITVDRGSDFVAIPVFLSRAFRHHSIYVNTSSGITSPADLAGKVVGIPEYQMTAAVWMRGILAEHHGLPIDAVTYRTGGLHSPGRPEKIAIRPQGVTVTPLGEGETLAGLLVDGEIDALYTPRVPGPYAEGDPRVARLFPESRVAESAYFRESGGVFPIMHTVVIRKDIYEQDRWLARSLLKAFTESKGLALAGLAETAALTSSLPFAYENAREVQELMGHDFWPYGVEANRKTISKLMSYSHAQGLISRELEVEELFAPECHASFVI